MALGVGFSLGPGVGYPDTEAEETKKRENVFIEQLQKRVCVLQEYVTKLETAISILNYGDYLRLEAACKTFVEETSAGGK